MDADLHREIESCLNELRAAANLLTGAADRMDAAVQGTGELRISGDMRHYASRYAQAADRLRRVR